MRFEENGAVIAYLGLGTNLGDRMHNMMVARGMVSALPSVELCRVSSVYESDPVGMPGGELFLNAVFCVRTSLSPQALLEALEKIELVMGRTGKGGLGPRPIDLDILLYGSSAVQEEGLSIPHPRMHERRFVLVPLCEIAAETLHPLLNKTVREILLDLRDENGVRFYSHFAEESPRA
jgi:2-amino-4-hydroxy-6-hydroxymethyldihydropteridine diphosphokinase